MLIELTVSRHEVGGPPGCSQEPADLRREEKDQQMPQAGCGPVSDRSFLALTCPCTTLSQHCVMFLRLLLGRAAEGPGLRSRVLLFLLTVETEGKRSGSVSALE